MDFATLSPTLMVVKLLLFIYLLIYIYILSWVKFLFTLEMVNVLEPSLTKTPVIIGIGFNAVSEFFTNIFFCIPLFEECLFCKFRQKLFRSSRNWSTESFFHYQISNFNAQNMTDMIIMFWKICWVLHSCKSAIHMEIWKIRKMYSSQCMLIFFL